MLVTRAAHQAGKLSEALRELGAEPVEVPVLEILPPRSFEALDAALRQFDQYHWLILTSTNSVRVFAERAAALGIASGSFSAIKVAAVGDATAAAARNAGLQVGFVPDSYVAESLVEGLFARAAEQSREARVEAKFSALVADEVECQTGVLAGSQAEATT